MSGPVIAAAGAAFVGALAVAASFRCVLALPWALARQQTAAHALRAVAAGVVAHVRRRRDLRRVDVALPDVLESVARSLRSGSALSVALAQATPASPPLLVDEWRRLVAHAADVGTAAAARRWVASPPTRACLLAASALAAAAEGGGPQARALDAVAATLRQRLALAAEVRALSSQARASAALLAAAPAVFAVIASGLEPGYLPFLVGTPTGLALLACGLALDLAGFAWMRSLTAAVAK